MDSDDISGYDEEEESLLGSDDLDSTDEGSVIAREDIKLMNVVRAIVILILLTFAFITSETIFVVVTIGEQNAFRAAYEQSSNEIVAGFYADIDNKLWMAQTLAAQFQGQNTWPNVSIDNFEARTEATLLLTKSYSASMSPLLSDVARESFEAYAAENYVSSKFGNFSSSDFVDYFPTLRTPAMGVYRFVDGQAASLKIDTPLLFPFWQTSPSLGNDTDLVVTLFDQLTSPVREQAVSRMILRSGAVMSTFLFGDSNGTDLAEYLQPASTLAYPISEEQELKAAINLEFEWSQVFDGVLAVEEEQPLTVVVENACGGNFSYLVSGIESTYVGEGVTLEGNIDGYTPIESSYEAFAALFTTHGVVEINPETACNYRVTIYPTPAFKGQFLKSTPVISRFTVLAIFFFTVAIFLGYDCLVEQRQTKVIHAAQRSDAIVRSLFPEAVRDRLYQNARQKEDQNQWKNPRLIEAPKHKLKKFVNEPGEDGDQSMHLEPIADLFPHTTILFADIAGFTAWSSEREPTQVFTLLETIYRAMDRVAKRLKVFKVETVGDCYVAATGLPDPQPNHAMIMARFARACLLRTSHLMKVLEGQLGPGTGELALRFGIHSGAVTAGVLRGQKARFQLFGDTMNFAARMESTGVKGKIQVSADTAMLIINSGNPGWVQEREEAVIVKGKGECKTYWLSIGNTTNSSRSSHSSEASNDVEDFVPRSGLRKAIGSMFTGTKLEGIFGVTEIDEKLERLIDWNKDVLVSLLKPVVAAANARGEQDQKVTVDVERAVAGKGRVLDQIQMVIGLPEFDAEVQDKIEHHNVELGAEVAQELREFVAAIASGYPRNPFHNFEHASHVILSTNKLLKRIVSPDEVGPDQKTTITVQDLHEHTFGIGSDPITSFAIVFSALIHDVGHPGVPNGRLAEEHPELAAKYRKSIAEQRSVDIAWDLLMMPRFQNLRRCIYRTRAECERFRALLVNSVMATDIFDKELKALRESRWDQAFHDTKESAMSKEDADRKATIVIEHIIQASDVAHTMQHWHIYVKWNERLFREMHLAYLAGRAEKDPAEGWFGGELWFFDNYIIPLAGKLRECGVFGVSCDEYLTYAQQNRHEWERKGASVVAGMKERAEKEALKLGLIQIKEEEGEISVKSGSNEQDTSSTGPISVESSEAEVCEVVAPPGKLGLTIDTSSGTPTVHEIDPESPLKDKLHVHDQIIEIDGVKTDSMSAHAIRAFICASSDHERRLKVERKVL